MTVNETARIAPQPIGETGMNKQQTQERKAARIAKQNARQIPATEVFTLALLETLKKSSDTLDSRKAS
jgi:hypothetical protein